MREKRTVVWERKRQQRPIGSAAAERIRARMQPNAVTRITDWIFEACDSAVEAVDRFEANLKRRAAVGPGLMLALMTVAFFFVGGPAEVPRFFAGVAMLIVGWRAFSEWNKRRPLPPVYARRRRDEVRAVCEAVVAGLILVAAQVLIFGGGGQGNPLNPGALLMNAGIGAFGLFRARVDDSQRSEPPRHLLGVALLVVVILLMWGFGAAMNLPTE